jgi:hypothetical protein
LDFIFSHSIFKGTGFINTTSIPKATASLLLNALVEGGVLIPVREKQGVQVKFIVLIDFLKFLCRQQ